MRVSNPHVNEKIHPKNGADRPILGATSNGKSLISTKKLTGWTGWTGYRNGGTGIDEENHRMCNEGSFCERLHPVNPVHPVQYFLFWLRRLSRCAFAFEKLNAKAQRRRDAEAKNPCHP
jgi:hypothetical protein